MFDVKGILKDFGNLGQSRMFRTKLLAMRSMLAKQTDNLQASYLRKKYIFENSKLVKLHGNKYLLFSFLLSTKKMPKITTFYLRSMHDKCDSY